MNTPTPEASDVPPLEGEAAQGSTDAPRARLRAAEMRYDEGVELLKAAVDEVRHHAARPVELPGRQDAKRRVPRNGKRSGNGRGSDIAVDPDVEEIPDDEEVEGREEIDDLDSEPADVRRRRRSGRHRHGTAIRRGTEPDGDEYHRAGNGGLAPTPAPSPVAGPDAEVSPSAQPEPVDGEDGALSTELDGAVVAASDAAAVSHAPRPPLLDRRRVRTLLAAGTALALVVIGILAVGAANDRGSNQSTSTDGARADSSARFAFDEIPVAAGATAERGWTLGGSEGSRFVGKLTFSNSTGAPLDISHTEVIPKALASSVDDIEFEPDPVVLETDPVVRFDVTVPANGTVEASYRIDVAPLGAERSRLEEWADALESELASRAAATTTTTTTAPPQATTTTSAPAPQGGAAPGAPAPTPARGTIIIATRSEQGTGTFGFSGPGGNLSVTTSGSPHGAGQSALAVSPGTYSWTEVSLPPGWRLAAVDCTDKEAGPFEQRSTVSGATATFNVQPGETVVCTWANEPA